MARRHRDSGTSKSPARDEASISLASSSSSASIKSEDSEQGSMNNTQCSLVIGESSSCVDSQSLYESSKEMNFRPGAKLEAKDLGNDTWYPVKIIEVDWEGEEILIHFEKWSARYDEWIPMDSPRLRPAQKGDLLHEKSKTFAVGEEVMATWSDSRKYPAQIKSILDDDKYEVVFFDGFQKVIKGCRMSKLSKGQLESLTELVPSLLHKEEVVEESESVAPSPQPATPPQPAAPQLMVEMKRKVNIFDTSSEEIGSKEGRRERKRKLNVAELLHPRKRLRNTENHSEKAQKVTGTDQRKMDESVNAITTAVKKEVESNEESFSEEPDVSGAELPLESKISVRRNPWLTRKSRRKCQRSPREPPSFKVKMSFTKRMSIEDNKSSDSKTYFPYRRRRRKKINFLNPVKLFSQPDTNNRKQEDGKPETILKTDNTKTSENLALEEQSSEDTGTNEKSGEVPDPNLPSGWSKWCVQRLRGTLAGKWDVFLVGPDGHKLRTHTEVRSYCAENNIPFSKSVFNFSLGRRKYKRRNLSQSSDGLPVKDNKSNVQGFSSPLNSEPHAPRRIKTLLPKIRSSSDAAHEIDQSCVQFPNSSDTTIPTSGQEGEVIMGGLKIQMDNSAFVCPKEGCSKHFRKESLLQMHLKHYHPEYNKYVSSTPNVADLAYARTVGESVDDLVPKSRYSVSVITPEKIPRFESVKRVKAMSPISSADTYFGERKKSLTKDKISTTPGRKALKNFSADDWPEDSVGAAVNNTGETPSLINMNTRESLAEGNGEQVPLTTTIKTLLPVSASPSQALDISLEDRLKTLDKEVTKSDSASPSLTHDETMKNRASSIRKRNYSSIILESSPVKKRRSGGLESNSVSDDGYSLIEPRSSSYRCTKRRASMYPAEKLDEIIDSNSSGRETPRKKIDALQRKIDYLKREELINCVCGIVEEDGLMIQCDVCLCWQHGICNNIEKEENVPEKYVCYICQNPFRGRFSRKYFHDQEWLKEGKHPSLSFRSKNRAVIHQREQLLKRSHDATSMLLQLQQVLHSMRVKLKIVEKTDHPKLYLWAKHWDNGRKYESLQIDKINVDKKHIGFIGAPNETGGKQYGLDTLKVPSLSNTEVLSGSEHFSGLDILKEDILRHSVNLSENPPTLSDLDLLKAPILAEPNEEEFVSSVEIQKNTTVNDTPILKESKGTILKESKSILNITGGTELEPDSIDNSIYKCTDGNLSVVSDAKLLEKCEDSVETEAKCKEEGDESGKCISKDEVSSAINSEVIHHEKSKENFGICSPKNGDLVLEKDSSTSLESSNILVNVGSVSSDTVTSTNDDDKHVKSSDTIEVAKDSGNGSGVENFNSTRNVDSTAYEEITAATVKHSENSSLSLSNNKEEHINSADFSSSVSTELSKDVNSDVVKENSVSVSVEEKDDEKEILHPTTNGEDNDCNYHKESLGDGASFGIKHDETGASVNEKSAPDIPKEISYPSMEKEIKLDCSKEEYDEKKDEDIDNKDDFRNKLYSGKCDSDDSLLQQALISGNDINIGHGFDQSLQLPICQNELMQFVANRLNEAEQQQQQQATRIPQPEAPIDPQECRLSLLDHIKHYQEMIEMRLSALETQVSALEAEDPDMINDEPADFYPRTKQTVTMLLRDLQTMQHLAGVR